MIAYKVVSKEYRSFILNQALPRSSLFNLLYKINNITNCVPNSPGIMCFTTIKMAKNFILNVMPFNYIILQVQGKNKMITPTKILVFLTENNLRNYCNNDCSHISTTTSLIPSGTICFKSVKPIKIIEESL